MRRMILLVLVLFLTMPAHLAVAQYGEAIGEDDGAIGGEDVDGEAVGEGDEPIGGEEVGGEAAGEGDEPIGGEPVY